MLKWQLTLAKSAMLNLHNNPNFKITISTLCGMQSSGHIELTRLSNYVYKVLSICYKEFCAKYILFVFNNIVDYDYYAGFDYIANVKLYSADQLRRDASKKETSSYIGIYITISTFTSIRPSCPVVSRHTSNSCSCITKCH